MCRSTGSSCAAWDLVVSAPARKKACDYTICQLRQWGRRPTQHCWRSYCACAISVTGCGVACDCKGNACGCNSKGAGSNRRIFVSLPNTLEQSGVASNLAIWRILQSGACSFKVNLTLMSIWRNLALASIWPIWRQYQSGNLAPGSI